MKKNFDPAGQQWVQDLLKSPQARQVQQALNNMDPQTLQRLRAMAQNIDPATLGQAMKNGGGSIPANMSKQDVEQALRDLLKG